MDFITQCYYSRMRLYRDRPDISVPGRWHWCPPGAKFIPYYHAFGSFTMDPGQERIDPPVGEIPQKNGRSRGESSPRYTGQHFCGSEQDWTQGGLYADRGNVPVDEEGVPLCCDAAAELPGGDLVGGDALQFTGTLIEGGEAEGGNLVVIYPGGEAEGGDLVQVALPVVGGGEAEGGGLALTGRTVLAGEAEGGDLVLTGFGIPGGEAEGGDLVLTFGGGETEGGDLVLTGFGIPGGEAEGGDLVLAPFIGGAETEGGGPLLDLVGGGETEGGGLQLSGETGGGGEAEGGDLVLTGETIPGGDAEGGGPLLDLVGGAETEGGLALPLLPGLSLWLDALTLPLAQGDPVDTWSNLADLANNPTQGTALLQPTYDPAGAGLSAAVLFPGGKSLTLATGVATTTHWTSYAVVIPRANTMFFAPVLGDSALAGNEYPGVNWFPASSDLAAVEVAGGGRTTSASWDGVTPHIISSRRSGLFLQQSLDAVLPIDHTVATGAGASSVDTIGAGFTAGVSFDGWVAELLVFERELSAEEDQLVLIYLAAKWGVTI